MYSIIQQNYPSLESLKYSSLYGDKDSFDFVSLESIDVNYTMARNFSNEKDVVIKQTKNEKDGVFIREMFEREMGPSLKITKDWVRKLNKFRLSFTIRNEEHINFFGGNLFGVDIVRFLQSDRDYIFEELCGVPEVVIKNKLDTLETINKNFLVSSDPLNNTIIYLVYKILNEKSLNDADKQTATTDLMLLMNYRFYTSLMYRYFQFQADPEIAKATYAGLSRKFAIKQFGNWNAVFENRVSEILSPESIHIDTLKTMNSDLAVRYAISDIQGRIRSMCKLLTREHIKMVESKERIRSESSFMEHEGEEILKDRTKSLRIHTDYLKSIVTSENSFIKSTLVNVITKVMPTMPPNHFNSVLSFMVKEARKPNNQEINNIINDTLIHAFGYLYQNKQMVKNTNDLASIIVKLRGTYTSSRNSDQLLIELKASVEELVKRSTKIKHAGNISAIRTGILLYIVARSLTIKYYSS